MLATYRLQLTESFTFARAAAAAPYIADLGISHLYLSPILNAKSAHGYDVVDPREINPVLGDFDVLVDAARAQNLGIVLDIVPNHMSASAQNAWWMDVLRKGPSSQYARVFDIDWEKGDGKVVLPFLGSNEYPQSAFCELVDWRIGERMRNWRRFFDVSELIGIRVEDPWVFDLTHEFVISLVRAGKVQGLRLDHIDGLRDPAAYLRRLRDAVGPDVWIVAEKILARGEDVPKSWPIDGTTGYDYIDVADGLFVDPRGWRALRRGAPSYARIVADAKREMLRGPFAGELDSVVDLLGDEAPRKGLREAVIEITAQLDTYRTYADASGMSSADRARIRAAVAKAKVKDERALRIVADAFLRCEPLEAVLRWQQLSGPAMAKGAEDTALYRYPVLISRNEVGCSPGDPPTTPDEFHAWARTRSRTTMNASSTHDTKRGEDVRARVDVLSERPPDFPDDGVKRFFHQTVIGSYVEGDEYVDRIVAVMRKSIRERKIETSWREPNDDYEAKVEAYVRDSLADPKFVRGIKRILRETEAAATANSLGRVVLKIFTPGVPDFYQGAEDLYLRLVDPDNRAPAPFAGGGVKYEVTKTALDVRRRFLDVCERGSYEPVRAGDGVIAFIRRYRKRAVLVAVQRPPREAKGRLRVEGQWRDAFSGELRGRLDLGEFFERVPVAVLTTG